MELNNLRFYRFKSDPGYEWILISCDPVTIDCRERMRCTLIWETQDRTTSGTLFFGDSTQREVTWIDTVASSLRTTPALPSKDLAGEIAKKTDAEIISMLDIDHDPVAQGKERFDGRRGFGD